MTKIIKLTEDEQIRQNQLLRAKAEHEELMKQLEEIKKRNKNEKE